MLGFKRRALIRGWYRIICKDPPESVREVRWTDARWVRNLSEVADSRSIVSEQPRTSQTAKMSMPNPNSLNPVPALFFC